MAKAIAIPTTPGFVRASMRLINTVSATTSPFSGKTRTQQFDYVAWQMDLALPPMKRDQARQWQSFFLKLNGPENYFFLADPDGAAPTGTYNGNYLLSDVNTARYPYDVDVTLSFDGSNNRITATEADNSDRFVNAEVGDFFFVTGAVNDANNGTHKILAKPSVKVVQVDSNLVTESNTANCKTLTNQKGSTGLTLIGEENKSGTIKAGDWLSIRNTGGVEQLVMATEQATVTTQTDNYDHYSVAIQPRLRSTLANNASVGFRNDGDRTDEYNVGQWRLTSEVTWDADRIGLYSLAFTCQEFT